MAQVYETNKAFSALADLLNDIQADYDKLVAGNLTEDETWDVVYNIYGPLDFLPNVIKENLKSIKKKFKLTTEDIKEIKEWYASQEAE